MALIPPERVQCVYQDGQCGRTALYAVKNADAADTVDVATHFSIVKRGGIVSDIGTTIGAGDDRRYSAHHSDQSV